MMLMMMMVGIILLRPVNSANRKLGFHLILMQYPQHLYRSRHTQNPVIPASSRLRIEMRPRDCWGTITLALADSELIPHFIYGDFAAEGFCGGGEPVAGELVGVGKGEPGHSCFCWCSESVGS